MRPESLRKALLVIHAIVIAGSTAMAFTNNLPFSTHGALYLRYDASVGIETSSVGGVTRWANVADEDLSPGDDRDLNQGVDANQPLFLASVFAINGLAAISFDGVLNATADFLETSAAGIMENMNEFEMYLIARASGADGRHSRIVDEGNFGVGNRVFTYGTDGSTPSRMKTVMDMVNPSSIVELVEMVEPTTSLGAYHIYAMRLSAVGGGRLSLETDGIEVAVAWDVGHTRSGIGSTLRIGAGKALTADPTEVAIAEMIVFNRILTPNEHNGVGERLADKYAIDAAFPNAGRLEIHAALELAWPSESGTLYQVEWTESLNPASWSTLGSPTVGAGGVESVFESIRYSEGKYYRLQQLP